MSNRDPSERMSRPIDDLDPSERLARLLESESEFFKQQSEELYKRMYPADVRPRTPPFEFPPIRRTLAQRLRLAVRRLRIQLAIVVAGYDFTDGED